MTAALSATHRPLAPMMRVLVMCESGMRGPHISEAACQMCEYMYTCFSYFVHVPHAMLDW